MNINNETLTVINCVILKKKKTASDFYQIIAASFHLHVANLVNFVLLERSPALRASRKRRKCRSRSDRAASEEHLNPKMAPCSAHTLFAVSCCRCRQTLQQREDLQLDYIPGYPAVFWNSQASPRFPFICGTVL